MATSSKVCIAALVALTSIGSLSNVLAQTSTTREAKRHFDRATELELSNDPRAEQEYRLAIRASGGRFPQALEKLSLCLRRQMRFVEAAVALDDYIKQTPLEDHDDDRLESAGLRRMASLRVGIESSEKPSLVDFLEFIEGVAQYAGHENAITYAEKAVSLYPFSSKAHVVLARLLVPDRKDRALELLKKAVELDPQNAEVYSARGWHYLWSARRITEAEQDFRRALELSNGSDETAWQGLGHILVLQRKKKEAIEAFQKYLLVRKRPSQYDNEIKRLIEKLEQLP